MSKLFCLSGVGYLHDISHQNDGMHAKINVINGFNSSLHNSDDIWIDCIIKDNDVMQLTKFGRYLKANQIVIWEFDVQYYQVGMIKSDPKSIVFIKGTLLRVRECYIDGVKHRDGILVHEQNGNMLKINQHI
jgi:hypothetical protein